MQPHGPARGGGSPGRADGSPAAPPPATSPVRGPSDPGASHVARNSTNVLAPPVVRLPIGRHAAAIRPRTRFRIWVPTNTGGVLSVEHLGKGKVDLRRADDSVVKTANKKITYTVPSGEQGIFYAVAQGAVGDYVKCEFTQTSWSREGASDTDAALIPWNFYYWPTAKKIKGKLNRWPQMAQDVLSRYAAATGRPSKNAASWEDSNHSQPEGEGWEGHCHHAAPASALFEPPAAATLGSSRFSAEEIKFLMTEYYGNFGRIAGGWELKRGNAKPAKSRFYLPAYFKPADSKDRAHLQRAFQFMRLSDPEGAAEDVVGQFESEAAFAKQVGQWMGELAAEFYTFLISAIRQQKQPLVSNMRTYEGQRGPHEIWNQCFFYYHAWYQENGDTHDPKDIVIYTYLAANYDDYDAGMPATESGGAVTVSGKVLHFYHRWRIQFDGGGDIVISDPRNEWQSIRNQKGEELFAPTELLLLGKPAAIRKSSERPSGAGHPDVGLELVRPGFARLHKRFR